MNKKYKVIEFEEVLRDGKPQLNKLREIPDIIRSHAEYLIDKARDRKSQIEPNDGSVELTPKPTIITVMYRKVKDKFKVITRA